MSQPRMQRFRRRQSLSFTLITSIIILFSRLLLIHIGFYLLSFGIMNFFLYNEFLLREIYYKIDAWRKKTHKDYTLIKTICWFPSNELQCTFLILIEAAAIEKGRAITCSD